MSVSAVQAAITTSGNLTGGGTPYAGQDPWNTANLAIGDTNLGKLTITGGSKVNDTSVTDGPVVALNAGASGSVLTVDGVGSQFNAKVGLVVGRFGRGSLIIKNGGSASSYSVDLGNGADSTAAVGGGTSPSTLTATDSINVGDSGNNSTMSITGGGKVFSRYGNLGTNGTGTVNVGGGVGSSTWTNSLTLAVGVSNFGQSGAGVLNITGGGSVSSYDCTIGAGSTSSGTVSVGGGTGTATLTTTDELYVGGLGNGTLTIAGGGSVSSGSGYIGGNSAPVFNGTVNVGGGVGSSQWTNSGPLYVGYSGRGTLNITGGGSVSTTSNIYLAYSSGGTVTVGGGVGSSMLMGGDTLYVGTSADGTLNVTGGGIVSAKNGTIGDGTFRIGKVNVGGGTGPSSLSLSGQLHIGNQGTGILNVTAGGSVSVGGTYTQNASSTLAFALNDVLSQPGHVPLSITGAASLAGTLEIDPAAGFVPTVGETFDVLTAAGGVSGTFSASNTNWVGSWHRVFFSTIYSANKVTISVNSVVSFLPGDYNGNGIVDAADYTVWRDHLGQNFALQNRDPSASGPIGAGDYTFWVTHFGQSGSGTGSGLRSGCRAGAEHDVADARVGDWVHCSSAPSAHEDPHLTSPRGRGIGTRGDAASKVKAGRALLGEPAVAPGVNGLPLCNDARISWEPKRSRRKMALPEVVNYEHVYRRCFDATIAVYSSGAD